MFFGTQCIFSFISVVYVFATIRGELKIVIMKPRNTRAILWIC